MNLLMKIFFLGFLALAQADDCKCRLKTLNRVNNGDVSVEHEMPWIVSLAVNGKHFCGGSILNNKFIITTASCVKNKKPSSINVRIGIHNIQDEIPKNQIYYVEKIHSKYFLSPDKPGDIAILELKSKINFVDGLIEKGCYNLEKREYEHEFLAAGWGYTSISYKNLKTNKNIYNGKLDYLTQAYLSQADECFDFLICLKPNEKKQSMCLGESGSPLHYTENGVTKIEGVLSSVAMIETNDLITYCTGNSYYSRLSIYADWINKVTDYDFCGAGQKPESEKVEKKKLFGLF